MDNAEYYRLPTPDLKNYFDYFSLTRLVFWILEKLCTRPSSWRVGHVEPDIYKVHLSHTHTHSHPFLVEEALH